MTLRHAASCLLVLAAAVSCKGDATGPGGLSFPEISALVRETFCIRGNATVGQTKSGSISISDCDDDSGYYETYIVKVATARTVTFTVGSGFDSFLLLLEVDSFSATDMAATFLDADDDSGGGLDAELSFTLEPGVDYVIMVSGLDYGEVGSYTLQIQ